MKVPGSRRKLKDKTPHERSKSPAKLTVNRPVDRRCRRMSIAIGTNVLRLLMRDNEAQRAGAVRIVQAAAEGSAQAFFGKTVISTPPVAGLHP